MASFDFVSFIIGGLVFSIIVLTLIWAAYFTRSFLFTYCPTQSRSCGGADFFNDVGDALANNPQITVADILFLNDQDQMFYKRVPQTTACVPESNQLVYMKFPQYCSFSTTGGTAGIWKETAFNSNIYKPDGFVGPTVMTDGDCHPTPGSSVTSGIPIIRWDPNPISQTNNISNIHMNVEYLY